MSEQTQLRLELKKEAFGWFIKQLSPVIDCAFSERFCRDTAAIAASAPLLLLSYVQSIFNPHFGVSSSLQCHSNAVKYIGTPRMYLRSGYFLVFSIIDLRYEIKPNGF